MNSTIRHSLMAILLLSSCLLLGCGGCAASEKNKKISEVISVEIGEASVKKAEAPLKAENIFVYLLFNRALQQDHEQNIVITLQELSKFSPPATVFVDAGVWGLENKSKKILPLMETGLEIHPKNISLHLLYAELLQNNGQHDKAIAHIKDFIAQNPHEGDAKIELAILYSNTKQYQEAENILRSMEGEDRTSIVEYYHAKALLGLKKNAQAILHLEKSVEKSPEFMEALNDLAFLYEKNKDLSKARDAYEKMLMVQGNNPELILRVIMLSLRLNEPQKALEYFEDSPMTPELTVTVASMFVDVGNFDVAEPILLGLADIPNAPQDLYFYLAAIAYERDKAPDKAYEWLIHIEKNSKFYERALFLRMQLLLDMENFEQALKEARMGKDVTPNDAQFALAEIRILATLDRFQEALQACDEALKKWPQNADLAFLRASVLDQSGEKDKAFTAMENIIRTNPENFQALNYVGYTLAEQSKDLQRAVSLLRKANELSPNSNYILDSLAWALFKQGENQEAWDVINEAIQAAGVLDPTIWEHYGDIAHSLGKKDEARKGYTKALELSPQNPSTITYKLNRL